MKGGYKGQAVCFFHSYYRYLNRLGVIPLDKNKNRGGQGFDPQPGRGNDDKGHNGNGNGNNGGNGRPRTPGTSHPSVTIWKQK